MRRLMAGYSARRSIGVMVGEREVSSCVMAATPMGKEVMATASEPREGGSLAEVLARALGPWVRPKAGPRPRVVLGIPEVRVFLSARTKTAVARKEPEVWLQEAFQTQGARVDDMVLDVAEAGVAKRTMVGLVACRRRWLAEPWGLLEAMGARLARAEPAPCAMLRAASEALRPPRGAKLVARFLLGQGWALGMLVARGVPLHWRSFDLPTGDEPSALLSALIALRMQARGWRVDAVVDAAMIQGRPDLASRLVPSELAERMGVKVVRGDGPGADPASAARGLALAGLGDETGYDLARTLKRRESIREIFPWADLAMQSAMLGGALLLMADRAGSLEADRASARSELARFKWLGTRTEADLEAEKKALEMKAKVAEAFLGSRVDWSEQARDIASRLPENTRLASFQGLGELDLLGGKGQSPLRKSLILKLETPVPPTGETPREVDALLGSLRDQSAVRREFPVIELKDLKAARSSGKVSVAVASYNIVAMPPLKPAPAPPSPPDKKD